MLTPSAIHATEMYGDHRMMTCREIDRLDAARELYAEVREAVDQSCQVCLDGVRVRVEGRCVWSVEEALELTKGM